MEMCLITICLKDDPHTITAITIFPNCLNCKHLWGRSQGPVHGARGPAAAHLKMGFVHEPRSEDRDAVFVNLCIGAAFEGTSEVLLAVEH